MEPSINQFWLSSFIYPLRRLRRHLPIKGEESFRVLYLFGVKLRKKQQFCNMPYGTLFLIPVPLADGVAAKSFTPYLVYTINNINEYIVENEKTARKFLKEAGLK